MQLSSKTSTKPNTAVVVQLHCTENSTAKLTYAIVSKPTHGTLGAINQTTGKVTYTPEKGYTGGDQFTYKATNAYGSS